MGLKRITLAITALLCYGSSGAQSIGAPNTDIYVRGGMRIAEGLKFTAPYRVPGNEDSTFIYINGGIVYRGRVKGIDTAFLRASYYPKDSVYTKSQTNSLVSDLDSAITVTNAFAGVLIATKPVDSVVRVGDSIRHYNKLTGSYKPIYAPASIGVIHDLQAVTDDGAVTNNNMTYSSPYGSVEIGNIDGDAGISINDGDFTSLTDNGGLRAAKVIVVGGGGTNEIQESFTTGNKLNSLPTHNGRFIVDYDTANKWLNSLRKKPGSDSVQYYKNGIWTYAYRDSAGTSGGSGTVSSVGLTMPSAFSVSGSPVTSSGTLAVSATGSSAQYILGTGALATFPTSNTAFTNGAAYLTANQTISLSGDVSGTGTTSITTTVGRLLGADLPTNTAGFLKSNGSGWSFDNTTYLPTSTAASTYLPLAGGTLTGALNFNSGSLQSSSTGQKMFATGSNIFYLYTGTSGINFTNQANTTTIATLSNAGAFSATGNVTGANLSGTNTGDETTTRINALYGYTPANPASVVASNTAITGATKTKITYDSKGLVTAGADATTSDIAEGSNLYHTDARSRAAMSLTTTGSGAASYNSTTGVLNVPTPSAGGSGTVTSVGLTAPAWLAVGSSPVTTSGTLAITAATGQTANQFLATPNGSTGAVALRAIAAADVPTLNQNTTGSSATATALQTARTINGTSFDGTANITVTAAAGTLTGATLASSVTASSLTSVGTITSGIWNGTALTSTYLPATTVYTTASQTLSNKTIDAASNSISNISLAAGSSNITGRLADANMTQIGANTVVANPTASTADRSTVSLSASQLFGRGSTGNLAPITLGTNLSMSGTTLNAAGGGGGGGTIATTSSVLKGDGAGNAVAATPGTDYQQTPDIQTFTSSGTWTKPANARRVFVTVIGAGGGGGSGRKGAGATNRYGGGGGGGGGISMMNYDAGELSGTVTITVGTGGNGGASVTTNSTNGNPGTAGTVSYFGSYLRGNGGALGAGGSNSNGLGGSGGTGLTSSGGAAANASVSGVPNSPAVYNYGATGGPAGGGVATTNAATSGGNGNNSSTFAPPNSLTTNGGVAETSGTSGATPIPGSYYAPGGGGGSITAAGGGSGGSQATGAYGAGGAGGGAATDSVGNSGAGSAGASGAVIVITYF